MNTIEEILEAGYDIKLSNQVKRMSLTNSDNDRDFHLRYCWEVKNKGKNITYPGEWHGFDTPKECIENMITSMKKRINYNDEIGKTMEQTDNGKSNTNDDVNDELDSFF